MAEKGYFDLPPEALKLPEYALPHYALPNFSNVLPEYANTETDVIRNAFSAANYRSIADLPDAVRHGAVNRSRLEKMTTNRQSPLEGTAAFGGTETVLFGELRRLPDKTNKPKCFMEFAYSAPPYSLADELAKEERLQFHAKVAEVGHTRAFTSADTRARHRHEDMAGKFSEYIVDPFECAEDQVLRQKWLMDAQVLAGPFKPTGRARGAANETAGEMTNRQQLPEVVAGLGAVLSEDWEEYAPLVCATDDEHIVVRFGMDMLEQEPGLIAYMNVLAATHEAVTRHKLRKVVEDWNVTPGDGYIYFTFRPAWVHVAQVETYYALHPEQRVFTDRKAQAQAARAAAAAAAASAARDGSAPQRVADGGGGDDIS